MDSGDQSVADSSERRALRKRALGVFAQSLSVAAVVTAALVLL